MEVARQVAALKKCHFRMGHQCQKDAEYLKVRQVAALLTEYKIKIYY